MGNSTLTCACQHGSAAGYLIQRRLTAAAVILALVAVADLLLRALSLRVARALGPDGVPVAARLVAVARDAVLLGLAVTIAVGRFMAL
jgi:small neutral amino acid transporter SnatA (MarC family)